MLAGSAAIKAPVIVATTANIALSGEQRIDGTVTSASRVRVKDQKVLPWPTRYEAELQPQTKGPPSLAGPASSQ